MQINNSRGSVWRKWDLHMHSNASDGKSNPRELIEEAKRKGVEVIALTDHHTVNNIDEIKRIGKELGVVVISGIEFRTEYGQKSVHMIGLFPDSYNNITLDQNALNDLILTKLDLSRTQIIQNAKEKGIVGKSDDDTYRDGLLMTQVDFKKAAELIREHGGLVTVHAGTKSNSIEEMRHEGSGARNVDNIADSLGPLKEELLKDYIDICEVSKVKDADFYFRTFKKASIAASDAHATSEVARNFTWIKGDATFEGLKQIIYEPIERVRIQDEEPERKNDYLVLESLNIEHSDFLKQEIPFNQGLNTIIGGRSSGKSILLGCIARLCGDKTCIKKNKKGYDDYIDNVIKKMKIRWRDDIEGDNRKVDFFPQGHIIDLACDKEKIIDFVESIFKSEKTFSEKMEFLREFSHEKISEIHGLFAKYQIIKSNLKDDEVVLEKLGSKQGIEKEIEKLKSVIVQIKEQLPQKLTSEEESNFEQQKSELIELKATKEVLLQEVNYLRNLEQEELFRKIEFDAELLHNDNLQMIERLYEKIKLDAQKEWIENINKIIDSQMGFIFDVDDKIRLIETSDEYDSAIKFYDGNDEYKRNAVLLSNEIERLEKIKRTEAAINEKTKELLMLKNKILDTHKSIYLQHKEFCDDGVIEREDLKIKPYVLFKKNYYDGIIEGAFDARASVNQILIGYDFKSVETHCEFLSTAFDDLVNDKFVLKKGNETDTIAESLMAMDVFDIGYNIKYQNDDLESMSEGKMAFVVLRLLLDFSDKDCPILIDQPEDDLDNRAIYSELVGYLRNKKKKRQIILVTHNPNIVVSADAEEIIVANQNGIDSPNPDNKKFAYFTGALENTFKNRDENNVLIKQGIREHVCEILEGGNQAFIEREHKYQL